ncbi:hypothetical protein AVEN_184162-1 [Araneus ventricosus]|uniref:Uncharacterized protein n=1 Tax=Araneus ventricosus TaxID=182803 RepID=A0A4Y2B153_ARAVE|nr:hypothetical protein AVEN_184162-1 [Araneus ventricosus]
MSIAIGVAQSDVIICQDSFTDVPRICLGPYNHRISIWRERVMRNNPNFVLERSQNRGYWVMVWVRVSADGRTDLYTVCPRKDLFPPSCLVGGCCCSNCLY